MSSRNQLRLALGPGPPCEGCGLRTVCGAAELDEACHPGWGAPQQGGVNVLHPGNPETWEYLTEIGGPGFDDVVARPQPHLELPDFSHRIRVRRALDGHLHDPLYLAGPEVVDRSRLVSRDELRALTGLGSGQSVGLILFGKDKVLERLWARRFLLVPAIARAGYDFCVPPSYSNYLDRPRPEFLFNTKRSLEFFQLLQIHSVPTMPRVAWIIDHDARRFADWVNANPAISAVALDLSDSSRAGWQRELRLLHRFDRLTGSSISYLIHGPSVTDRCADLYNLLGLARVHLTNARAMARPPTLGMLYGSRFARERRQVESAQHRVRTAASPSMVPRAA